MSDPEMAAMVLERVGGPLRPARLPVPEPGAGQVRVRVSVCGVCRTDLHVYDGELAAPKLPLVLGHEVVGRIDRCGAGVTGLETGARVGVPWLGGVCGACPDCIGERENLCPQARFTGYQADGGYAEFVVADAGFVFPLPEALDDLHAAPLLCAGLIGFRASRVAGEAAHLGLYGFGAAAHILCQLAVGQGRRVSAFTRPGDAAGQAFARSLGAAWAGGADELPPDPLDAAILFAPAGELVPRALQAVRPGGRVVCAGIHMSPIPSFPYELLWRERSLHSVANLTRQDGHDFFAALATHPIRTEVRAYALRDADQALQDLRQGNLQGAAALVISGSDID